MKVQHKNSREQFDLSIPKYTKLSGMYGFLTATSKGVFFICSDECEDVSKDFDKL